MAVRGEHRATIDLETREILAGNLPPKLFKRVRQLLDANASDAMAAWEATQQGKPMGALGSASPSSTMDL